MDTQVETGEEAANPSNSGKVGYKNPPVATRFKAGESPNPGGKPTKSRNRLQGKFFLNLADDFDKHGKQAIIDCREKDPVAYVKTVASLMPKEFELSTPMSELTDEQLDAALAAAHAILAAQSGRSGQDMGNDESGAECAQSAEVL